MTHEPAPLATIRVEGDSVVILDQTLLPHRVATRKLTTLADCATAISTMQVRGAPLIGATAAFGVALALRTDGSTARLTAALATLQATRPTAVNLRWALARMQTALAALPAEQRRGAAWREAQAICDQDRIANRAIGEYGLELLRTLKLRGRAPLRVMTHCNAGWLATVAHGTALAPVYAAHARGLPIRVLVSETRPRNQGLLSAWELAQSGVRHTLIADNAAGVLLQRGEVDAVIVGADRIAANGDVANKVGTYLKALAAQAAGVPFYVAAPLSTIDWEAPSGADIPIEERDGDEVRRVTGTVAKGEALSVRLADAATEVANPAFDVTPAILVTAIVSEYGVAAAQSLHELPGAPAPRARGV